jgi:hypothetical protein
LKRIASQYLGNRRAVDGGGGERGEKGIENSLVN